MDYSTPINKNLWTNKITNDADARLFICHLLLDIGVIPVHAELSDWGTEGNPVFTDEGALAYDNILNQLYIMPNGEPQLIISQITDEVFKWFDVDNNNPIKSIEVKSILSGKVMYIAEFKSDFPLISVLYSVNNSDRNQKHKKIGYGTLLFFPKTNQTEQSYSMYDNESKKYFEGILYKLVDGSFIINAASK